MIQAIAYDLLLLTAATDEPIRDYGAYEEESHHTLNKYLEQLKYINEQLIQNPATNSYSLRIPITGRLSNELCLFWNKVPYDKLRKLRTIIMSLLLRRNPRSRSVIWLKDAQIEHFYQIRNEEDKDGNEIEAIPFPDILSEDLCSSWIETVGVCTFECGKDSQVSPDPLSAVCIIANRDLPSEISVISTPCLAADQEPAELEVLVLAQPDNVVLEHGVREILWDDKRLPYGPIGYYPPQHWQIGQRPSQYGYRDRFGGEWEWEGRRADNGRNPNPFHGHWNVQLPTARVKQQWVNWIEHCTGRRICTRPRKISHINVESDGNIGDRTFDWCN